jgi:hypothetical protein
MPGRTQHHILRGGATLGLAATWERGRAGQLVTVVSQRGTVRGFVMQTELGRDLLQVLSDEREIRGVVDGIDAAADAKEWGTCRAYFAEMVDVDFTSLGGGRPASVPADTLIDGWRRNLYAEKKTLHMRSNHQIVIRDDRAQVTSKGYAFNFLPSPTGSDLWEVWGEYHHTLVRTPNDWKVTAMALQVLYARGNERARDFVPSM